MERRNRANRRLGLLLGLTVLAAVLSICIGPVLLTPAQLWDALFGSRSGTAYQIVRHVRIPRTLGCLLAGMALAVSGAIIQSVLANPLAAPNIIGVNAGAGLLVALSCALFPAAISFLPLTAFCGAFLGAMLVLGIAQRTGASKLTLVLAGVAVSQICNAGIDAIITFVPTALNGYSDFRIGGFSNVSLDRLRPAAVLILVGVAVALAMAGSLDVLMLGSDTAQSLGLSVKRVRLGFLAVAAALAGAAVSFAGLLGFVGLLVPHMVRRLLGEDSWTLLLGSALGGAVLVTVCDLAARTLFAPYELPVGIVLSLVGGPFFIWLLLKQRRHRA
jgi:iron complex transport system permease protein